MVTIRACFGAVGARGGRGLWGVLGFGKSPPSYSMTLRGLVGRPRTGLFDGVSHGQLDNSQSHTPNQAQGDQTCTLMGSLFVLSLGSLGV